MLLCHENYVNDKGGCNTQYMQQMSKPIEVMEMS